LLVVWHPVNAIIDKAPSSILFMIKKLIFILNPQMFFRH
jgi:hypothetical protein